MRLTKIIGTIGPASINRMPELVEAGLDVARINFSHGSDEDHARAHAAARAAADSVGRPVGILADLSGPKVRMGEVEKGEMYLAPGSRFVLRSGNGVGTPEGAFTDYAGLPSDLHPGDVVLLADGAAELKVVSCNGEVVTEVVCGGRVRSRAGVNVPGERLSIAAVTAKDKADLGKALDLGVDFVAQSFVRRVADVEELRELIGDAPVKVIAKIETRPAVDDVDAISKVCDGLMLARGDLGVELPFADIPVIQKNILRGAAGTGVACIVATQMLESMVLSPRPTRAEASDAANAVIDGTDAVLLSAETAIGDYPIEAVRAASAILEAAEASGLEYARDRRQPAPTTHGQAIAQSAGALSLRDPSIRAIACYSRAGNTAALLSAARPKVPIFAFSPDPAVRNALTIRRGVVPQPCRLPSDTDDIIGEMDERLGSGLVPPGTTVLFVASTPVGVTGTNLLKVHRVGG